MYARRSRVFSGLKCDLVTVLVCINLTLPLRKWRSARDSVSKVLLFTMLINSHNHWHDVFGRRQIIHKLSEILGVDAHASKSKHKLHPICK